MNEKIINNITFLRKMGKLALGFDMVKEAVYEGEVYLVLLAKDLSEKTKSQVEFLCENYKVNVRQTDISLDEFWHLIGKRCGVLGVMNKPFADKLTTLIDEYTS